MVFPIAQYHLLKRFFFLQWIGFSLCQKSLDCTSVGYFWVTCLVLLIYVYILLSVAHDLGSCTYLERQYLVKWFFQLFCLFFQKIVFLAILGPMPLHFRISMSVYKTLMSALIGITVSLCISLKRLASLYCWLFQSMNIFLI